MTRHLPRLLLVFAALATAAVAAAQTTNPASALGGSGRYVFGQINEFSADQYLLDTQTGRLWRLVDTADGRSSVLEAILFSLPEGGSQALPPDPAAIRSPLPVDPLSEDQ